MSKTLSATPGLDCSLDAVSQPRNKRIRDKPTYTKTFRGDVLSSASVNLSLRLLRNIIIAEMRQLRFENCTSTKFKATWGHKKQEINPRFSLLEHFLCILITAPPPTRWNMSVITETHGSAFGLNEAEHFSLITPRESSISGEEGRRVAGDRKLR